MSDNATAFWTRLKSWYGYQFIEKNGETPGREWQQLLNNIDRETIINTLAGIKTAHPKFPPNFIEVSQAISKASKPIDVVNVRTVLAEYVLREFHAGTLGITFRQLGMTWNWIANLQSGLDSQGAMRDNQQCEYIGVFIPPDCREAGSRGFRIMYAEIDRHLIPSLLAKNKARTQPKVIV